MGTPNYSLPPGYTQSGGTLTATEIAAANAATISGNVAGGSATTLYPGAAAALGYTGVVGSTNQSGQYLYTVYQNGVVIGQQTSSSPSAGMSYAESLGVSAGSINTITPGALATPLGNGSYSVGVSGPSAVGPVTSGASMPGGGGVGGGGSTIPGGTAGFPTVQGAASSVLAGLSHTTAGLNWSHIALWLAILAGGYIALGALAGGKRRRR